MFSRFLFELPSTPPVNGYEMQKKKNQKHRPSYNLYYTASILLCRAVMQTIQYYYILFAVRALQLKRNN